MKLLDSLRGLALRVGEKTLTSLGARGTAGPGTPAAPDLSWVPAFWESVRDYIFVREEDDVVILPPNLVYKTNATGVRVLKALESGARLERVAGLDAAKLADIAAFLGDIRDLCDGKNVATSQVPYGFDFTRLPILGEIAVTYRCNNRCLFCYAGCGGGSCGQGGAGAAAASAAAACAAAAPAASPSPDRTSRT